MLLENWLKSNRNYAVAWVIVLAAMFGAGWVYRGAFVGAQSNVEDRVLRGGKI